MSISIFAVCSGVNDIVGSSRSSFVSSDWSFGSFVGVGVGFYRFLMSSIIPLVLFEQKVRRYFDDRHKVLIRGMNDVARRHDR